MYGMRPFEIWLISNLYAVRGLARAVGYHPEFGRGRGRAGSS